ncbi:programmed cell death protein 4 isoform X1 [Selaginella moellendorffii]|nr:programmed cell death protein 4 isoform X1 [Selaginella moellendorffii]|eukprot:XP_002986347.2 programmed cell death protein 4 isoform X1 [Selaginella moellendorffii]
MAVLTDDQRKVMSSACMERGREKNSSNRKKPCKAKKAGGSGKGTWGSQLDQIVELRIHPDDPNYDSEEEPYWLVEAPVAESVEEFKGRVLLAIEEYFMSSNIDEAAQELRDLGCPDFQHYFVKKLVSIAMDKRDREKEKAAVLLSALYADVVPADQMAKGFRKLLLSVDNLVLDNPNAVKILAVFVARAVVDDILPPAFLTDAQKLLAEGSKGMEVVNKAMATHLGPSAHADMVEKKWGGSTRSTVELLVKKIDETLEEYRESGDVTKACQCIRELDMGYYHHELVKRAATLSLKSNKSTQSSLLALLKHCSEEGLISPSQMSKGFMRCLEESSAEAREKLKPLVSAAVNEGWLSPSLQTSLASAAPEPDFSSAEFKKKSTAIIHEYFSSDDSQEVLRSLQDLASVQDLYPLFIKRLILLAMDRRSREKEMASSLLSIIHTESDTDQVAKGFVLLLESAEDTALDTPDAGTQLTFFLARAVFDNVLTPFYLEQIKGQLLENSLGREIVGNAKSILSAQHAGERILRCWGGGTGWAIEDAKDKVFKIVEEFEAGGDLTEACRCIRELNMPFFHHEIVKRVLDMAMEKQNERPLELLEQCSREGLITTSQMCAGFTRVYNLLNELALDVPNAHEKFQSYVETAKQAKWLRGEFDFQGGLC